MDAIFVQNHRLSLEKVEMCTFDIQICTNVVFRLRFEQFTNETYPSEQLSSDVEASFIQNHGLSLEKVEKVEKVYI